MLGRKLLYGYSPKGVISLLGRMYGSNRTVRRTIRAFSAPRDDNDESDQLHTSISI